MDIKTQEHFIRQSLKNYCDAQEVVYDDLNLWDMTFSPLETTEIVKAAMTAWERQQNQVLSEALSELAEVYKNLYEIGNWSKTFEEFLVNAPDSPYIKAKHLLTPSTEDKK